MRTSILAILLALALLAGACATSAAAPDTPEVDPIVDPGEPAAEPDDPDIGDEFPEMAVDWYGEFTLKLPIGWTVHHCDGEASIVCFSDGDRHVGGVEIGDYAIGDDFDGDARSYLYRHAESFLAGMREDRAEGCPGLAFEAVPTVDFDLGGVPGVRAEFRVIDGIGAEVERNVLYWAIHDGAQYVIAATATAEEGGCLERLGEFEPHDLAVALPYIDRLVRDTPLPLAMHTTQAGPLEDGAHTVRISDMDGPVQVVYVEQVDLLTGQAAVDAAREAGVIGPDDDLPNDVYSATAGPERTPSRSATQSVSPSTTAPRAANSSRSPVGDFLADRRPAMNDNHAAFSITISNSKITDIAEIYLP